ncbi:MAG: TIM barrel protein [Candidatus Korarchaeota archaeon]|nr:TIM barrel protein [Candidatus Korarchaeota archaeon]
MTKGLRLLCSTDFMWGAELPEVVKLLVKSGCEGIVVSTEPPRYLPSLLHRSVISHLRTVLRELDTIVAVRSPVSDVNVFSTNPHIAEASIKSIEEAMRLAYSINADFLVIRPSQRPYEGNPLVAARKLQALVTRLDRDHYAAFELIGSNSKEIADRLADPRLGVVYIHEHTPASMLAHRKLVGVAVHTSDTRPLHRVIPGLREDTPYLLLYPDERRMFETAMIKRIVLRAKNWRNSLI